MSGTLPAGLLCAVAGIMLAFVPVRSAATGTLLLVLIAFAASYVPMPAFPLCVPLAGCWSGLLACAICVYWRTPLHPAVAVGLAANAGLWAGIVAATGSEVASSPLGVAAVLCGIPAAWSVHKGYEIVPRIVTSWLLAVAMIAAVLPLVVTHPGYVPDHME